MVPLLTIAWLVTGSIAASKTYISTTNLYARVASLEPAVDSHVRCAEACQRQGADCDGFSFTEDGVCQLFSEMCPTQQPNPNTLTVRHVPEGSDLVAPCPPGWYFYRQSCYSRHTGHAGVPQAEARLSCQSLSACSDLVELSDSKEQYWMFHHNSRTSNGAWTGVTRQGGTYTNLVGGPLSFQPTVMSGHIEEGCLMVRSGTSAEFRLVPCNEEIVGYVCESPLQCRTRSPCPTGWLGVDNYCYIFVPEARSWHSANSYCQGRESTARISSIVNMETWHILRNSLGISGEIWVGISDISNEGSFYAVDGTAWSLWFRSGEPNNGGGDEDCLALNSQANDIPCHWSLRFMCRMPRLTC